MADVPDLVTLVSARPGLSPGQLHRLRRDLGRFLADVDLAVLKQAPASAMSRSGPAASTMSLRDLAIYSGLSVRTLRGYIDLPPGEALPVFRVGGKIVVKVAEFDAWIEQFRAQGRPSLARAVRELGLDRAVHTEKRP